MLTELSVLCKQSLKRKWHKGSMGTLDDTCSFCHECCNICSKCKCPIEICEDGSLKGYIRTLKDIYGNDAPLSEISDMDMNHMRFLFEKHILFKKYIIE